MGVKLKSTNTEFPIILFVTTIREWTYSQQPLPVPCLMLACQANATATRTATASWPSATPLCREIIMAQAAQAAAAAAHRIQSIRAEPCRTCVKIAPPLQTVSSPVLSFATSGAAGCGSLIVDCTMTSPHVCTERGAGVGLA